VAELSADTAETTEQTMVIKLPAGSRRRGFEPFIVQDLRV
jgi:hypothetical protein